jgi:ribose transport system ATP-binding protein
VAVECRVLVLDEPTSSLTQRDTKNLFSLIARLKEKGLAIVYISHFLEEVQAIASHFTVLRDGATVGSGRVEQTDLSEMVRLMAGRKIDQLFSRSSREQLEVVLELDQLAGDPYPSAASLELRRGEVFGVAGLVGAGRTELLRAIYGLGPVRSGRIRVKTWHGPSRPEQRVAQGVGLLSEDRKGEGLAASLSVAENLTLSKLPASRWGWLPRKRQNEAARTWADKLAIKLGSVEQPVGSLSGGNQQKVALGRLLHQDADVLLLDEPTRGIDVGSKAQVYEIIDELARQGKAVLMVSSYMPELLGMCDTIAVMRRGRLGPARPREQWSERALLEAATGGAT